MRIFLAKIRLGLGKFTPRVDSGPRRLTLEKKTKKKNPHAVALGKLGGAKGGKARARNLSAAELSAIGRLGGKVGGKARAAALKPSERQAIARKGAAVRWGKVAEPEGPDTES
jgi:hypothetical protein